MTAQACLNGWRTPDESPAIPVTAADLAAEALAAVRAGADSIHLHPKDPSGRDTLDPTAVATTLAAVRELVGGVPVGVTTGSWAAVDALQRHRLVSRWTELSDVASVNWHEGGSVDLAELLLERGVGIEAGLHTPAAVAAWARWPHRDLTTRVLLEVVDPTSPADARARARELLAAIDHVDTGASVLLHGEEVGCWPVFDEAVARGLDWRIGLEDTLVLPDGTAARSNADLVAAAFARAG